MTKEHSVSIIIPCRNEEAFIADCLESVLPGAGDFKHLEILVIDGQSTDRTPAILSDYSSRYPIIRILTNPGKTVPKAMNIGIKAARGEIIVRLDAHSKYPANYVKDCVSLLLRTGSGNAGGRIVNVPNGDGKWAEPVAFVTGHKFGVGNGAFRVGSKPGFVDTVPYGTFKKELFNIVGFYDERLTRTEDDELNARIRAKGYTISFDPGIKILYKNQAELSGLLRQAYNTSRWNIYTMAIGLYSFQPRRFVPLVFVLYLFLIPACFFFTKCFASLYLLPAIVYALLNTVISFRAPYSLLCRVRICLVFLSYHITYGLGSIVGLLKLISGRWKSELGRPLES